MKQWALIPLFIIYNFSGLSQSDCKIILKGTVLDAESKLPIAYANILIDSINKGTITDEQGHFQINGLCPGHSLLQASHIECSHLSQNLDLSENIEIVIYLHHHDIELEKITISATAPGFERIVNIKKLDDRLLRLQAGKTFGDLLTNINGVSLLKTGNTIVKPILHGMHSNRILIIQNGVNQEGQEWGVEHAPEIDAAGVEKIDIISGSQSVAYGSDAIGGVINISSYNYEPDTNVWHAKLFNSLASNGRGDNVMGMLSKTGTLKYPYRFLIKSSLKKSGNQKSPGYFQDNTGTRETNFALNFGYKIFKKWDIDFYYSLFNNRLGILTDSHFGNLEDLQNAIKRGRPLSKGNFSYKIERPFQNIEHELAVIKNTLSTGLGKLKLNFSRQFDLRQEYDSHKRFGFFDENKTPQIEFELTAFNAESIFEHLPIGGLKGQAGIQLKWKDNLVDRGGLFPSANLFSSGIFITERWHQHGFPLDIEAGVRLQNIHWTVRPGALNEQTTKNGQAIWNIGLIYIPSPELRIQWNTGTAWRAPSMNELYSDGVHHGTASYEQGNPNMKAEEAFSNMIHLSYTKSHKYFINVEAYHYQFKNFIYLAPRGTPEITIRGIFPAFLYNQTRATIYGLDASFGYELFFHRITGEHHLSYTHGWNKNLNDFLPLLPPIQLKHLWTVWLKSSEHEQNSFLHARVFNVFKQRKAPSLNEYASPPPAYWLAGLDLGTKSKLFNISTEFILGVDNLFNISYKDYLNRFRYFTADSGRNFSFKMNFVF